MQPNLNINANQILLELNKVPEKIHFDIIYHVSGQKVKKKLTKIYKKSNFIIVLAEKLTREHCRTESNIQYVVFNTSINIVRENDLSGL